MEDPGTVYSQIVGNLESVRDNISCQIATQSIYV